MIQSQKNFQNISFNNPPNNNKIKEDTVTKADNYRSNSENILHTNKEIRMYGESEEAVPMSYYSDLQIF